MPSETRAAVQVQNEAQSTARRRYSITAYGEDAKGSFKDRIARQQALPLSNFRQTNVNVPGGQYNPPTSDSLLKRKTPYGTLLRGYDASAYGLDGHDQPMKHLILQAPKAVGSLNDHTAPNTTFQTLSRKAQHKYNHTTDHLAERLRCPLANSEVHSHSLSPAYMNYALPPQNSSVQDIGPSACNVALSQWPSTTTYNVQQTLLFSDAHFQAGSPYYPIHASPVHEPAMQAIDQRIDRLTLHDYTPPTSSGLRNDCYGDRTLYGQSRPGSRYRERAHLPTFAQRAGFRTFEHSNWAQPQPFPERPQQPKRFPIYQDLNTYAHTSSIGYQDLISGVHTTLSYPEEILRRAHVLYASMQRTARDMNQHHGISNFTGDYSRSPLSYPSPDCACHLTVKEKQNSSTHVAESHDFGPGRPPRNQSQPYKGDLDTFVDTGPPSSTSSRHCCHDMTDSTFDLYLSSSTQQQLSEDRSVPSVHNGKAIFYGADSSCVPLNASFPTHHLASTSDFTTHSLNIEAAVQSTLDNLQDLAFDGRGNLRVRIALMAGCLAFSIGQYERATSWFEKAAHRGTCHIALSNLALTSLAVKAYQAAETYWQRSLDLCPTHFDTAEQLVGLLCAQKRHKQAIQTIDRICTVLNAESRSKQQRPDDLRHYPVHGLHGPNLTRLLGLIHAKGNIQYGLHQHVGAAKAFTEAVLLATGLRSGSLADLVHMVLARLSGQGSAFPHLSNDPLLLDPSRALETVQICFGHAGHLPGLHTINDMGARKTALSIISSSLLSLAKIFQDGMISTAKSYESLNAVFGVKEILALYYLSLSLQPSPSTANNVGILLAGIHQQSGASGKPAQTGDGPNLAAAFYSYGLTLDPRHAHLYTNFGSLLKDKGQLQDAISMYEKAVACDPTFDIALANLANAVKDQGKTDDAIIYYKRAVKANPNFVEAVCGLANALNSICSWSGRGGAYFHNGAFDRWHVNENDTLVDAQVVTRGSGWIQRVIEAVDKQLLEGEDWGAGMVQSFLGQENVGEMLPGNALDRKTLKNISGWHLQRWEGANVVRLVERTMRQTMRRWYRDKYLKRNERAPSAYYRPQLPTSSTSPSSPTVLPFHTFTLPLGARQIRLISQRNGLRVSYGTLRSPWLPATVFPPPAPPSPHLNVGYVSSDFNNHPLAHLMQSVFGMHDGKRVKAFCYATTASDNSSHRRKIEEEAPVFYDASSWSSERLLHQISGDGIHILVNLNGYTRGARNEVFAARPTPVQMSFMGFAGSLGAEWCDYILADETAIPQSALRPYRNNVTISDLLQDENHTSPSTSWVYGENIIFTRDAFFCCDHAQSASLSERSLTFSDELIRRNRMRRDLFPDIPPDAIILANFNQLYKIDPTTFRTWLRILYRLPRAYLWLLRFPASGATNLLRLATSWAAPAIASRILFTDVAPKHIHIARGCIADLFLDTPECNAHTTAADCLWSGTPLLTLPRYEWKMCSRMGAGILGGALPTDTPAGRAAWRDLVAGSEDEYEESAVRLAGGLRYGRDGLSGVGRLMELRKMIWEGRWECKLFDTRRWVADVEVAYHEAWRRWVEGEGGDIWLKDLL